MNEIQFLKKQLEILLNNYNTKNYNLVISKGKPLIKKFPEQAIFANIVALSLSNLNRNEEAVEILNKSLNHNFNNIHILNNLGLIYTNINNFKLAREYLEKSIKLNKNFIDGIVNLSNLYLKEKNIKKAKDYLLQALKISKTVQTDEVINMSLGQLHQQTGEFEQARKNFEIVNRLNPNNTSADRGISTIHRYRNFDDNHLIEMEKKLSMIKDHNNLRSLYFALGKAYEDLSDFKKSFKYLKLGNELANKDLGYNINTDKELFSNIKNFFVGSKTLNNIECSKKIIFIVGMPRSGTTLVEQIISSHKDVFGAGELEFLSESVKTLMSEENKFEDKNIEQLNIDKLSKAQKNYVNQIETFNYEERYLTDKAPLNFRWIGFIFSMFPNSKIIHCNRKPMDTCFSNFKNSFAGKSLPFTYSLENIGHYYNLYKDLMSFWNTLFPKKIYDIHYENLIQKQEEETKKLINFCNLDWDAACLAPEKNKKIVATASLSQIRQSIYNSSIGKWENYSNDLEILKKILE